MLYKNENYSQSHQSISYCGSLAPLAELERIKFVKQIMPLSFKDHFGINLRYHLYKDYYINNLAFCFHADTICSHELS